MSASVFDAFVTVSYFVPEIYTQEQMNTLRLLFQQEAESRLLLTVSRFLASIFFFYCWPSPLSHKKWNPPWN